MDLCVVRKEEEEVGNDDEFYWISPIQKVMIFTWLEWSLGFSKVEKMARNVYIYQYEGQYSFLTIKLTD